MTEHLVTDEEVRQYSDALFFVSASGIVGDADIIVRLLATRAVCIEGLENEHWLRNAKYHDSEKCSTCSLLSQLHGTEQITKEER
jgi:hypothetical protein